MPGSLCFAALSKPYFCCAIAQCSTHAHAAWQWRTPRARTWVSYPAVHHTPPRGMFCSADLLAVKALTHSSPRVSTCPWPGAFPFALARAPLRVKGLAGSRGVRREGYCI